MTIWKRIGFLSSFSIPFLIIITYYFGNDWSSFLPSAFAYVLIPFLDLIVKKDAQNVLQEDIDKLTNDSYFDFLVYAHVWVQVGILAWEAFMLATNQISVIRLTGLIISQGVYASSIINIAHELGHRNNKLAQLHAKLALISVSYSHFTVEHNRGHHVHVATPLDPATSLKNQSVYAFWIQTLFKGFKSAWNIEKKRLSKTNESAFSLKNDVLNGVIFSILFVAILFTATSIYTGKIQWIVLTLFFAQSIIAILSLECVNYIEHYGILRSQNEQGRYERVNPLHSWNSNHTYSNFMLFQLQRHSDHHANATRPYQILRHFDESPQLPFGYPLMIMISLVPFAWFNFMNPKLEKWQLMREAYVGK